MKLTDMATGIFPTGMLLAIAFIIRGVVMVASFGLPGAFNVSIKGPVGKINPV